MDKKDKDAFTTLIGSLIWLRSNETACMDLFGETNIMEILYDTNIYDFVDEIETERQTALIYTEVSVGDVVALTNGREIVVYRKYPLSREIEGFDRNGNRVMVYSTEVKEIKDHLESVYCFLE